MGSIVQKLVVSCLNSTERRRTEGGRKEGKKNGRKKERKKGILDICRETYDQIPIHPHTTLRHRRPTSLYFYFTRIQRITKNEMDRSE